MNRYLAILFSCGLSLGLIHPPSHAQDAQQPKYVKSKSGVTTIFSVKEAPTDIYTVMAQVAVRELSASSIAIVDDRSAYGSGEIDSFRSAVRKLGGTIAITIYVSDKTTSFGDAARQLRTAGSDVVVTFTSDVIAGRFVRQMADIGLTPKVILPDETCSSTVYMRMTAGRIPDEMQYCMALAK